MAFIQPFIPGHIDIAARYCYCTNTFARRNEFADLPLSFHDITVNFPNATKAIADLTAVIEGTLKTDDDVEEAHELNCTLKKMEDTWHISTIQVVEVLEQ